MTNKLSPSAFHSTNTVYETSISATYEPYPSNFNISIYPLDLESAQTILDSISTTLHNLETYGSINPPQYPTDPSQ